MRPDERQAGAAYTYAWWLTGDDDAAVAAIRASVASLADAGADDDPLSALVRGVRAHVGEEHPMCAASELALLHDGLDVDLATAAELAGIDQSDATVQLAHGRLEGLLETVREDFDHPERLGGLAVANPPDIAHARQCPSCARARMLVERGRNELREVVAVSAPPGLLAGLVADIPRTIPPDEPSVDEGTDATEAPSAPDETAPETPPGEASPVAAPPAPPAPVAPAIPELPEPDEPEGATASDVDELAPPTGEELMQRPSLLRPPPAERKVPTTPARQRTAGILAGLGLLTAFALVTVLFAMGGSPQPGPDPEQPAVDAPTSAPEDTDAAAPTDAPGFGPDDGGGEGFTVADAGLLRSGEDTFAPSDVEVDPDEPLRLAVDYRNAVEGVPVTAVWRVDGEQYLRLRAVLAGSSSRHVWGLPVPPGGWPPGAHRIMITTDEGLAAAIDFRVAADA